MGLLAAAGAAAALAKNVSEVWARLNTSRTCLLEITNQTDRPLRVLDHAHDHGGFAEPPSFEIPPHTTDVFGSQSKAGSVMTGTEGGVRYRIGDLATTLRVGWDNPWAGGNDSSATLDGPDRLAFHVGSITGAGDNAHMKYELRPVDMRGHAVYGAILERWAALRYSDGPLGFPVMSEAGVPDGVGRYVNFEGGAIYWHPDPNVGAHAVWGDIGARWHQIGKEQFGYPVTDETATPDGVGRYNHFRKFVPGNTYDASIYWTPTTKAHEVYGAIRHKWATMGWERSHLGYPVAAEADFEGGRLQRFQGGALFWNGHDVVVR
jgi:LGFP repeat